MYTATPQGINAGVIVLFYQRVIYFYILWVRRGAAIVSDARSPTVVAPPPLGFAVYRMPMNTSQKVHFEQGPIRNSHKQSLPFMFVKYCMVRETG